MTPISNILSRYDAGEYSERDVVEKLRALDVTQQPWWPWQPIETAPKANGPILVFDSCDRRILTAEWWGPPQGWTDNARGSCYLEPSHWMPLPPPPSADAIREGGEA